MCVCKTFDCVVDGHSCGPHESCVDEQIDHSCDYVSDFQMEVVSRENVRDH